MPLNIIFKSSENQNFDKFNNKGKHCGCACMQNHSVYLNSLSFWSKKKNYKEHFSEREKQREINIMVRLCKFMQNIIYLTSKDTKKAAHVNFQHRLAAIIFSIIIRNIFLTVHRRNQRINRRIKKIKQPNLMVIFDE